MLQRGKQLDAVPDICDQKNIHCFFFLKGKVRLNIASIFEPSKSNLKMIFLSIRSMSVHFAFRFGYLHRTLPGYGSVTQLGYLVFVYLGCLAQFLLLLMFSKKSLFFGKQGHLESMSFFKVIKHVSNSRGQGESWQSKSQAAKVTSGAAAASAAQHWVNQCTGLGCLSQGPNGSP